VKSGRQALQEGLQIKFGNRNIFIKKNIMVQPKYSPEEALHRVKLMMGYDLKKTLKENVDNIPTLNEQAEACPNSIPYADVKSLAEQTGKKAFNMTSTFARMGSGEEKAQFILDAIKQVVGKNTYDEIDEKCIPARGVFDRFFIRASKSLFGFSGGKNVTQTLSEIAKDSYVKENFPEALRMIVRAQTIWNDSSKAPIPDTIPPAGKGFDSLRRAKEIKDTVCTAKKGDVEGRFTITIGGAKGNDLDNWARRNGVTPQEIVDARNSCGKKDTANSGGGGGSSRKSSFTPCVAGKYVRGCKSDVVKKVQACLDMPAKYHTGNFGPITQGELQKKFPDLAKGFTDADVTKICTKTVTTVKPTQPKGETSVDDANSL
jgi:hypothetical protein